MCQGDDVGNKRVTRKVYQLSFMPSIVNFNMRVTDVFFCFYELHAASYVYLSHVLCDVL